jgi:hypothetical protein
MNIGVFFIYYMGGALFGFAAIMLYVILIAPACGYYEMLILGKNTFLCGFLIFPLLATLMYFYPRFLGDKLKTRMYRPVSGEKIDGSSGTGDAEPTENSE